VLVTDEDCAALTGLHATVAALGPAGEPARIAARLYDALRDLDRARPDGILACDLDGDGGLRPAIRDRLRRAAAGRVVAT
jgi:hypothetical protein